MAKIADESGLSDKQKIFCQEYVFDWNASRAALVAGYSKKTYKQIGHENLKNPKVKAYIEEIQKDLAKLAGISALQNLTELKKIAFSSIAHLHNTWIELKDFEALTEEQKCAIESIDTKTEKRTITINDSTDVDIETVYVKLKLHSKTKALEMINSMMGWNAPTKTDITTKGNELPKTTEIVFVKKTD